VIEYGQVPVLELVDGTKIFQHSAILNYVGNVFKLVPKDPLLVYRGESIQQHFEVDFQAKYLNQAIWYAGGKGQ
jgi:glutathione S-transferase